MFIGCQRCTVEDGELTALEDIFLVIRGDGVQDALVLKREEKYKIPEGKEVTVLYLEGGKYPDPDSAGIKRFCHQLEVMDENSITISL